MIYTFVCYCYYYCNLCKVLLYMKSTVDCIIDALRKYLRLDRKVQHIVETRAEAGSAKFTKCL